MDYFQLDKARPSEEHDSIDSGSSLGAKELLPFGKS